MTAKRKPALRGGRQRDTGRRKALDRGKSGEWLAALALRFKGWRIVGRNFRCARGEIDIIARKGDLVAFVEVKARSTMYAALDAASPGAKRRIAAAGVIWISRQRDADQLSWRHDVVAVTPWRWPQHLQDAF